MEQIIGKVVLAPIKTCRVPTVPRQRRTDIPVFPSGFTLVELLAVVAILGMFASVAVLAIRHPISAARRQLEWEQFRGSDLTLRTLCRRQRKSATLTINLDQGICERRVEGIAPILLPETMSFEGFNQKGLLIRHGQVTLSYRADGTSDSFAVRMKNDPGTQWRFVCGGTGQWLDEVTYETVRSLHKNP